GPGDQLLWRWFVDVALDQDRICGLSGLVLGLRRQQLVLQIRREQTARGGDERHRNEQGKCARTHLWSLWPPRPPSFRRSGDLAGHEFAQTSQRAELQRADRAFVLTEHVRDLSARHVLDEAQHENFLLFRRQVLDRATKRIDFLTTDRVLVRGRSIFGETERVLEVDGRTLTTTAVRHRVASDRVEPREE